VRAEKVVEDVLKAAVLRLCGGGGSRSGLGSRGGCGSRLRSGSSLLLLRRLRLRTARGRCFGCAGRRRLRLLYLDLDARSAEEVIEELLQCDGRLLRDLLRFGFSLGLGLRRSGDGGSAEDVLYELPKVAGLSRCGGPLRLLLGLLSRLYRDAAAEELGEDVLELVCLLNN
jgi:hypothetical protein